VIGPTPPVTPLVISGTLDDPTGSGSPVRVATGTLRTCLSAPLPGVDWLTARGLPEDGTPGCREAFRNRAN